MKKLFFVFIFTILILTPLMASAVDESIINPFKGTSMESPIENVGQIVGDNDSLIIVIIKWIYTILFIVAVGYILWAAYDFVTSKGEPKKVEDAKSKLKYAVIAIAVALLATIIPSLVKDSLGGGSVNQDQNIEPTQYIEPTQCSPSFCAGHPTDPCCE